MQFSKSLLNVLTTISVKATGKYNFPNTSEYNFAHLQLSVYFTASKVASHRVLVPMNGELYQGYYVTILCMQYLLSGGAVDSCTFNFMGKSPSWLSLFYSYDLCQFSNLTFDFHLWRFCFCIFFSPLLRRIYNKMLVHYSIV